MIFIANVLSPNIIIKEKHYLYVGNLVKSRKIEHTITFLSLLVDANISPAFIYIYSHKSSPKLKKIIHICQELKLNYEITPSENRDLHLRLFYGPRGSRKLTDYDFDTSSESLQRIIEDYAPHGFFDINQMEDLDYLAKYFNFEYATTVNRFPSKVFRDSLEDIGGLNSHPFTIMIENSIVDDNIQYCTPVWKHC